MSDIDLDGETSVHIPFTSGQKELWLSSQTSLSGYTEVAIRARYVVGCLVSPERLRESIRFALSHTPLLNTTIHMQNGEPYFTARDGSDVDFRYLDFRGESDPEHAVQNFLASFFEESVDECLTRYALCHTGENESTFAFKCSHLVLDGLGGFFHPAFLADIYSVLTQGKELAFGEGCTCDELYQRDRAHCASSRFPKDMAYWRAYLEELPEKRIFRTRPGCPDMLGDTRYDKYILSAEASAHVEQLLAEKGLSPSVYFVALHALVISFMCGERAVVIQTPVAYGERKIYSKRQGAQIAMPPALVDTGRHETFGGLCSDIVARNTQFYRHILTPYQLAMRELTHKNLSYLADTFINYLPSQPKGNVDFPIRKIFQFHSEEEPILFGAMIMREADTDRFSLTVRSSRNHLSTQDVERYIRRLELLTEQLAAGVELPQLTYLLKEEEQELALWQRGDERAYTAGTIHDLFDDKARCFAEHPAVRDEHGGVLSYGELHENSIRCASWLAAKGVKQGDIVAVMAKRAINLPEVVLGIMRCGAIFLPVDPKAPAERIEYILADANAVMTIDLANTTYMDATCAEPSVFSDPAQSPADAAYLIYTSGSTGRPKGVIAPHAGFVNMIQGQIEVFGITEADRVLQFAPPVFDASLSEMFMALCAGACLYPVSDACRNEPWKLRQYMADNTISVVTFPPSYLHLFDRETFSGLRVLITAGEPPVAADALHYAASLDYFNAYGPTETCVCASMKRVSPDEPLPVSSGRPIPNCTAYILDAEGRSLPAGMVGELWIGGAGVALGYYGNTELTRARFRPLPEHGESVAYATGDLALWSEKGEIILVGRADDQVKIRGNRVELGEVAFLLERCSFVRQAAALAVEDASGQTVLAAFLILRNGTELENVIAWCRENLPLYMIPSLWQALSTMPVTSTGKVDRTALKGMVAHPSTESDLPQEMEPELLALCEKALGSPCRPEANFFDQGGDSLKAMALMHSIRNTYDVDIAYRHFVTCHTLFALQALLRANREETTHVSGTVTPLSQNQFQIWAYQQANDRSVDYNMPLLLEVEGEKAAAFLEAFRKAVSDQELLSCTVAGDIDHPHFVHSGSTAVMSVTDFPDAGSAMGHFDECIHTPFNLRNELPVRLVAARLADRYQLLVLVHHIVGDGETLELLLGNALQYLSGGVPAMGALSTQAAYCRREDSYLRSEEFRVDSAYWKDMLTPFPPSLNSSSHRMGAMETVGVTPEFATGIEEMARQSGVSVLAAFVSMLGQFLCRKYDAREVRMGVPVGLRETQEEFRTAGFFVNTLPLRIQCTSEGDATSAAKSIAAQLMEAVAHSRYCHTSPAPDFLATHAHYDSLQQRGLRLQRLLPQLRASKLSACFSLLTGNDAKLVLEYDGGFISDGKSLLQQLVREIEASCGAVSRKEPSQVLAEAWQDILHATADGQSDFFRYGGDSIKAIQITGILHRTGITTLTASDFLRTPGFADLCAMLEKDEAHLHEQYAYTAPEAGQVIPLLPIQHALIHDHPDHWQQFFMVLPLSLGAIVSREAIESWLASLPSRYEALQLSFSEAGAQMLHKPQTIVLHDGFTPTPEKANLFRAMTRSVIADLDPQSGKTLGAALAEGQGERFLLVVGHHLVLDTFSLDILHKDLLNHCHKAERVDEGFGVATRAVEVERLVIGGSFPTRRDRDFWESVCGTPTGPLEVVRSALPGQSGQPGLLDMSPDMADVKDLASERVYTTRSFEGFRPEYSQSPLADLLSGLACALHGQGQQHTVFVTLESHGRDTILPGLDSSSSLGWFTAVCPLPLAPFVSCEEARKVVQPWIGDNFTPLHCNAYGYLHKEDANRFGYHSQISVNYFGTLAVSAQSDVTSLLAFAVPGTIPELLHPAFEPESPLELAVYFDETGALHIGAYFSPRILPREWVSDLLARWTEALKTLPAYGRPQSAEVQAEICETCGCMPEDIEAIHLPDTSHESMLYQALSSGGRIYTQQVEFYFKGEVEDFLLLSAWNKVVERHESLRSLFPMPHEGEFYRVVLRKGRSGSEYHDLSHLPDDMAQRCMADLLEKQRNNGFDLNRGPLLRSQLFRLDDARFVVCWCFHHLLMDGWCMGILLRELFIIYNSLAGRNAEQLPPPVPLTEYTRWRTRFDETAARQYWTSLLDGFIPLTGVTKRPSKNDAGDPGTLELVLDATLTEELHSVAASHAVTLPVLVQALWSVLLSVENNTCRDVVFGVVTSGRPAELRGIDRTVGLFIQTLPLRVRWSEDSSLDDILSCVKEQSLQQMRHGYLPLAEMGRNLLDHLMVFENYPFETLLNGGRLELTDIHGYEKIPYPLGISVTPGTNLRFRFLYDPGCMEKEGVLLLMGRLHTVLQAVASGSVDTCRALELCLVDSVEGMHEVPERASVVSESRPFRVTVPSTPVDASGTGAVHSELVPVLMDIYTFVFGREVPSPDTDFFQMGGHSLLAMRVLAQVSKRLSVKISVEDVLTHSSVRKLAAHVASVMAPAVRIPCLPVRERYPLSFSQKRMWFLQRLHEDSRVYLIPFAARLNFPVDRNCLQGALALLEERHATLRLRVSADSPEQLLAPLGSLKLEYHEQDYAGDGVHDALHFSPMEFGFDNPLVRVALYQPMDSDPVLAMCFHHIVFDGWSAEVFLRDLNHAYDAVQSGLAPAWEPLGLDYVSYIDWESRQDMAGVDVMRQALLPLPERLRLPLDFPGLAVQSHSGAVHVFPLRSEQVQGLRQYAAEREVTLFPVLLALVDVFLHHHTGPHAGQTDVVVGCPAANREQEQTQDMIGLFVNTLAIRTVLDADSDFDHLVRQVQAVFQQALAAQSYPFEKVIDTLAVDRNLSRNPLFDVFVALEDASWSAYDQAPLCMVPIALPHDRSKFDLSVYFRETASDCFEVHLEYCTELFREETIRSMGERLSMLLDDVLRRHDAPLHTLDLIPERERALLKSFNATDEPFDNERDVDSCFRAQVPQSADQVAIMDHAGQVLSYAALDERASALAAHLADEGLSCGDYAGVCFDRSTDMLVAIFAVMRLGAIYVPLSTTLPEARLQSMFEDLGGCTVITTPQLAARFANCGQRVLAPVIAGLPERNFLPADIAPDAVAYVLFTSGSTGRPKGVQIEHHSLRNRLLWMQSRFPIGPGDVILQKTTVSFDVSIWELFWWSWCGASLALLEQGGEKDPEKIAQTVAVHSITVLHFVPSMLRAFLDYLERCPEDVKKLKSLRYVFTSGEALSVDLVTRFNALLRAELHNLYGPTEAAIDVTWYPCTETPGHCIPIGKPVSNTCMYVLDAQRRQVPPGVTGELYISGIQVARGYVNRPDLTEKSFLPDPFISGNRMYRTGDLGRWLPDGNIEYLGRNDDQVKIRGFRIELGEVETALNKCSGVSQAVVRMCRVGGYDALEAFLLPRTGAVLTFGQIREELSAMLPEYMYPALLHETDTIPLSPSGKADRKQVQGRLLQSGIETGRRVENPLHEEIRAIWREVMPEVAVTDPDMGFFEAGGNSLLLVQLHTLLNERWKNVFSLAALFAESTIRKQAQHIEQFHPETVVPVAVHTAPDAPVAIIGMAVRMGDYEDTESFWNDLAQGVDKNVPLSEKRQREVRQIFDAVGYEFDASRLREASYLSDISSFDYKRFGLSPSDATMLDPKQRLFLEVAMQALDDAGYGGSALENRAVGTFVGASPYRLFQDAISRAFPDQSEQIYLLNVPSNVVARISYLKNWSGPASTVDTACSSVLKAVHDACHSLRVGESCVALAGGVHTIDLPVKSDRTFTIEAASGRTRTFDAKAEGVGAGEGAAVFVLKLLDQAIKDNDAIHAVIAGSAVNQDGRSSSMAAPNPNAQAAVITLAARNASVPLSAINFFEAHGTATVLGDPVEVEGIAKAFVHAGCTPVRKALIGSVKGNIGHLDAAAGAAGLAKAVLSLKNGLVPPQPHFESPNPHIDFDAAPVRVARTLEALLPSDRPWHCGVSSFGLSGVNTHIIVKEHISSASPEITASDNSAWYCIPLSAGDDAGLLEYCRKVHDAIFRNDHWTLPSIAGTLIAGREHLEVRAVFVADSRRALLERLAGVICPVICPKVANAGIEAVGFATQDNAEAFAKSFLQGANPVWPEGEPVHRVHLPTTPFTRTSLWPRFADGFLSAPVETPTGKAFAVSIDRPEFWPVAEHRLQGVPTLVGMGMPDLIGRALGLSRLVIDDLRWKRPVTFDGDSRATLFVEPNDDGFSVTLQHCRNGEWNVAASASVRSGVASSPAVLDIAALREATHAFEPEGGQTLVRIGKRWHCREELRVSDDGNRLLARLSLPEEFRHDLHTYKWHPSMVDIAASLSLYGVTGFIPARCGQMKLHRPVPAVAYAHVVVTDRDSGMITADCFITDISGAVLVEMRELVFVALHRPISEPELHEVRWVPIDLPTSICGVHGNVLLLGAPEAPLYDVIAPLAALKSVLPELPEARKALAAEIVREAIAHIICLLPAGASPWHFGGLMQDIARAGLRQPLHVTAVGCGALAHHEQTPEHALALGLLLSLKQEEPLISTSYVEMEPSHLASVQAFLSSLGTMNGPYRISAEGQMLVQKLERAAATPSHRISPDGCVVITGGLGGMGLTLAEQITDETGARVVLLHRSGSVAPDLPFTAYRCDVTSAEQLAEVLSDIRRDIGPIQGVIHTAGIAGDGYLVTKDRTTYEAVLAPKVTGTWNLHTVTLKDDLRFFVLASSRTSLVGAPGQCDYTAANAFLNGFAAYRRHLGLPALALCWNTWSGVGMATRMHSASNGHTLAPEQAYGVLDRALSCESGLVVVSMSDEDVSSYRLASFMGQASEHVPEQMPKPEQATRQAVETAFLTIADGSMENAEAELLAIFKDCLGYEAELTRDDDFYDLGGDSIAGTRIISRVDKAFGVKASVIDLLESDTLGDFIDSILEELKKQAPAKQGMASAPERDKYPVGREQLSILYADLLGEQHLGYNLPAFLKLPDDLDRKRLEEAIATLIQRHEVLRTSFCDFEMEHPHMIVHPFEGFSLEETHIPDLSGKDAFITPFDLKRERGFRIRLLVVGESEYILFYDIHHALADGRTISLFNTELFRLYHGKELAPVTMQQKDMAWHQFTQDNSGDREYWLGVYKDGIPVMDLPADFPRPPIQTYRGGMYEFALSSELVANIKALARREGVTNYHVVLSAWVLLAHAYTGMDDIVVAITVDSRGDHYNTAGMLASLLPLRFAVNSKTALGQLLADNQKVSNDGLRHSAYILNNLLTDLHPPVSPGRSLLSEIILSYMNFEFATGEIELFEALRFSKGASKTDLSIFASDTGDSISFALEYYADLFRHEAIVRMAEDVVRILESMVSGSSEAPVCFEYSGRAEHKTGSDMGVVQRTVSPELVVALKLFADERHAPISMVAMATFAALVSRVTAQERFSIDFGLAHPVPFVIGEDTEIDGLLSGICEHLDNVKEETVEQTTDESFMAIGFVSGFAGAPLAALDGVEKRYDLVCTVHEHRDGMDVRFDYNTTALAPETAQDWLAYFELFLEGITKRNDDENI